jgi:transglutaminase-like putative cysteine protease
MFKRILLTLCFLLTVIFAPNAAASEFATSYDVLYDVGEDGVTTVTEKVTLKNLTSEYYADQFKLTIGASAISDIRASDAGGALEVKEEKKENITSLRIKFNQQIAGLGKTLPWTISFKSKDFAEKIGKVWEVRVPKISSGTNLETYNLTLAVPRSFGPPSIISPTPKNQTTSESKIFFTFDKEALASTGLSATFGTHQLFDFDLTYHLQNNNLTPANINIALPPDTSYQDVIYQRIEPVPVNVTLDKDGNYLAWYRLNRGEKKDVKVIGSAKLYSNSKVKDPFLDQSLRKKYTESNKYWEKENPEITAKLAEILDGTPADSTEKARVIFQFVVENLKYDSGRLKKNIERLGAVTALNNPASAVCMEFTDLFIALARAAGIPARELNGFAYTTNTTLRPLSMNKDILHAWPEYWDDRRGWVMVDPTWGNTTGGVDYFSKLDLNHFVFVIKGFSSSEPLAAGSYKYQNQDSKDVRINLSDTDFLGKPQLDVRIEAPETLLAGFPGSITIKVLNTGNALYPSMPLAVNTGRIVVFDPKLKDLGPIPPFGFAEFKFNIRTKSLLDLFDDQIQAAVGGQKFTKEIKVKPLVIFQTVPLMIGVVIAFMVLVYFTVLGGHFFRRRVKPVKPVKTEVPVKVKKKKAKR